MLHTKRIVTSWPLSLALHLGVSVMLVIAAVAWPTRAAAQPTAGLDHLRYSNTAYAQLNSRSLADDLRVRYRRALYRSSHPLFANNFVGLVAGAAIAPGLVRPTVGVEVQPLSVLSLSASFEPAYYFDVLGLAQSYPSPASDYRSGPFKAPKDGPGGSYPLFAPQLTLSATVQAAIDHVVFRSTFRATKLLGVDLHRGDRVLYDPSFDTVVYRNGWAAQNDTDVGVKYGNLVAGLRNTVVLAWYPSTARESGAPAENPNTPALRLGPIAQYTLFAGRGGLVDTASVVTVVQWHLQNRYRTGTEVSAALPLLGIGFTVAGDLL